MKITAEPEPRCAAETPRARRKSLTALALVAMVTAMCFSLIADAAGSRYKWLPPILAAATNSSTQPAPPSGGAYTLPLPNNAFVNAIGALSQNHWGGNYWAIDLMVPEGTPVYSASAGVVSNYSQGTCGNGLTILGDDGLSYLYCHGSSYTGVQPGTRVAAGQLILYSGNTGDSGAPHLHLEIKKWVGDWNSSQSYCSQRFLRAIYDGNTQSPLNFPATSGDCRASITGGSPGPSGCSMRSEYHRDPLTGWSWNNVWECDNTSGALIYPSASFTSGGNPAHLGYMNSTRSWFVCYAYGDLHAGGNRVWYYTLGDGFSSDSWKSSRSEPWGYMPANYVGTSDDPFLGIPECGGGSSVPPAESKTYLSAMEIGFGDVDSLAQRVIVNNGPRSSDDGVIVMRWFIPAATAAGGSLDGDNRSFSDDPNAALESRAVLTWDVATGRTSFIVNPSTLRGIHTPIKALPIMTYGSCSNVRSTDLHSRNTNDAFIGVDNGGLYVCASLLNSLTNRVGVSSWSVDVGVLITPSKLLRPGASGYDVSVVGNAYPAIEVNYYPRYIDTWHRLFRRRVDPFVSRLVDDGGGLAALNSESWFSCRTWAGETTSSCLWNPPIPYNPLHGWKSYETSW